MQLETSVEFSPAPVTARVDYHLVRLAGDDATVVARFSDRAEAIRAAWLAEGLGWRTEVRRLAENGRAAPPWVREYRSLTRRATSRDGARARRCPPAGGPR
jgi:hypothetical protein